jgi:hypothetical protein
LALRMNVICNICSLFHEHSYSISKSRQALW